MKPIIFLIEDNFLKFDNMGVLAIPEHFHLDFVIGILLVLIRRPTHIMNSIDLCGGDAQLQKITKLGNIYKLVADGIHSERNYPQFDTQKN